MKKILLIAMIPITIFGLYVAVNVEAHKVNYDVKLGNSLSNTNLTMNSYIEIEDKPEITYNFLIPNSFDKMAEDSELELYLEPETLAIAVRVKENGYVYSSYDLYSDFSSLSDSVVNPIKSGVSLDLYKESTAVTRTYLDIKKEPGKEDVAIAKSSITPLSNGFKARIDFDEALIKIRFNLIVTIEDGQLIISIPQESVEEYNPDIWGAGKQYFVLRNIVVYPYFGSTKGESDGYVVLPDGAGAIVDLDSTPDKVAIFGIDVYGKDLGYMSPSSLTRELTVKPIQRISMPIYGMIHDVGNTGFLVISEEGANYGVLNFKSAGPINKYYYTYFSYRYRESYEQYQSRADEEQFRISLQKDINEYDVKQKYVFLSGDNADYVGMAKAYQDYLLISDDLGEKHRSDYDQTPMKIDFVGTEITMGILRPKLREVTKYNEITSILEQLQKDGYNELTTALKTYNMSEDGYRFDVFRKLGGKSDFKEMLSTLEKNDIPFSYYLDYVRSYDNYSKKHAQTLSKREIYHIELSWWSYAHLVNHTKHYLSYAKNDVEDLNKFGINTVTLNGFDRSVYTSWDDGIVSSTENLIDVNETLKYFNDKNVMTNIYNPDAYMYAYTNEYYNAPISSSDFTFVSASIPFMQLVIGGYMDMYSDYLNFISDETTSLLRLVEFGVYPSYVLTGGSTYDLKETNSSYLYITEYDVLKDRISNYYNFIDEGLQASMNREMIDHTFVAEGVVLVEYEGNVQIMLNYNNAEVTINDVIVPAESYVVIQ